jgi:hypothetical protein
MHITIPLARVEKSDSCATWPSASKKAARIEEKRKVQIELPVAPFHLGKVCKRRPASAADQMLSV